MLSKILGSLLILMGIAGLVLPIVPGILLIMAGVLLFSKNKPAVDWVWVREELEKRERITPGYDSQKSLFIAKSLDEAIKKAKDLSRPAYTHTIKKISAIGSNHIDLEGGMRLSTSKIAKYIGGASHVIIFLVTIGEAIETEAGELTKDKDPLEGYLLDRIGSFAVENLAESVEKKIRKDYSILKKSVSRRYSPGYCDWPIEDQLMLDKILNFSKIGVTLNESYMMKPKKSISAIVAIAKNGVFTETGSTCVICEKKDCSYRRDS